MNAARHKNFLPERDSNLRPLGNMSRAEPPGIIILRVLIKADLKLP
jgi:hypothetical protein